MSGIRVAVLLVFLFANGQSVLASKQDDKEMNDLAKASGCYLCHSVASRKPGAQETLPLGPAWKDVAKKYKGQADAEDRLTRIVLHGTGSNLSDRHWNGKAEGAGMLPNAVEINEEDARKLVRWILSFGK
jgi:cytochrome c